MLGTVGNKDKTVVGGVDKEFVEEDKLLKKIPGIKGQNYRVLVQGC